MAEESTVLARQILGAANRTQARGSTVRLIVPRAPEVAEELGVELTDARLVEVEEYLQNHGYIAPTELNLTWGTYTITPAGLEWLEGLFSDEEAAFESALRAEVEEERRRLEEVEQELDVAHWEEPETGQEPQESPEASPLKPGSVEPAELAEPAQPADPDRVEPERVQPERAQPDKVEPDSAEPRPATGGPQTSRQRPFTNGEPERRGFWSRLFGG